MCIDGFGFLDSKFLINHNLKIVPLPGEVDVRNFQAGLYRCGKQISSIKAGQVCKTYNDCPTTIAGVYAKCGCTYSDTVYHCDILHYNSEYQDYVKATIAFQSATSHCHNARILESGPCDSLPSFRDM